VRHLIALVLVPSFSHPFLHGKLQYDSFRSQETRKFMLVALEEVWDREMNTTEFLLDSKEHDTALENGFVRHMLPHITQIVSKVTAPAMNAPAQHDKLVMANATVWLKYESPIKFVQFYRSRFSEKVLY
jgi:hypothetical protein